MFQPERIICWKSQMRKIAKILAAALMLASPALAENDPVVVELYTSQGCSSCPPADAFLHKLADRDDVIALAMHVDYWDYIGWKDIFASAENTKRQRAYARAGGRKMIYTPQMVINGSDHVVGNRPRDVLEVINKHKSSAAPVSLDVTRQGNKVTIRGTAEKPRNGDMTVQLVRYTPRAVVDIKRGENAGRKLSYANIVTDLEVLGSWNARKPLAMQATVQGDDPVDIIVQQKNAGPVVAAARIK